MSEGRQIWISTTEAAQMLGTDGPTLYQLISEGRLRATRIGLMSCLNISDVQAVVDASRIVPATMSHLDPDHAPASNDGFAA